MSGLPPEGGTGEDTWPVPVEVKPYQPSIVTSSLTREERHALWQHMQSHHTEFAQNIKELVASDAEDLGVIQSLMDQFDAGFQIPMDKVPPSLKGK